MTLSNPAVTKPYNVSILTIGTEVSSGEIVNTNASWLADQLTSLNLQVIRHVTVPDNTQLMHDSLNTCANDSSLIIATGGLGPTADDFTRNIISSWCSKPLEYDESSWLQIVDRLSRMNVPAAESNKQQCYFPRGSVVIKNPAGTANAFMVLHNDKTIICLPGPPTEIIALWNAALLSIIKERFPSPKYENLYYWHTIGISESQLGEIVEDALKGSGYTTGYRPHIPYVDVKVWTPPQVFRESDPYLLRLDAAISTYTLARQQEDVGQLFFQAASRYSSIVFVDGVTRGALAQRVGALECPLPQIQIVSAYNAAPWKDILSCDLHVTLLPAEEEGRCTLSIRGQDLTERSTPIKFPRRVTKETQSRYRKYMTEMCFVMSLKLLKNNAN